MNLPDLPMKYAISVGLTMAAAAGLTACGSGAGSTTASPLASRSSSAPAPASGSAPVLDRTAGDRMDGVAEQRRASRVRGLYGELFSPSGGSAQLATLAEPAARVHGSPSGARDIATHFAKLRQEVPGARAVIKHLASDGNLVAVHWQLTTRPEREDTGEAWGDLYRFDGDRIAELWTTRQKVPATTASGHSLFSDVYRYPGGTAPTLTESQEDSHRVMASTAYARLQAGESAVLDQYWDNGYRQHNPAAKDGLAAVKELFAAPAPASTTPGAGSGSASADPSSAQLATLGDGDLVWVFTELGSPDSVLLDIFRVSAGRITEHWDVAS
ncbi:MAG TPA: nuclear transport factor 2 family protein [Kineosporiaceae bacterium]